MTALLIALLSPAQAFELHGAAWAPDAWPLTWHVEVDSAADGLDAVQQQSVVQEALAAWDAAAPCVDLSAGYGGAVDRDESYDLYDGDLVFAYGDPEDVVPSGSEAVAWFRAEEKPLGSLYWDDETIEIDGMTQADVTFEGGLAWTTVGQACEDQVLAEVLALRVTGFLLGLGNSCTAENAASADCTDEEEAAVMFYAADLCDEALATPQADDVRGLLALYTPVGTSAQGETAIVAAGEELCLSRTALIGAAESVTWDLGDGSSAEGVEACHTWTDPGEYVVGVSYDDCTNDAWGEVLACSAPALPAGSEHAFDMTVNGDTVGVRLLDTTNDDRCVTSVRWEIIQTDVVVDTGSGVLDEFVLPPGVWTVAVTVTGVAGELTDQQQVTIGGDDGGDDTGPADTGEEGGKDGCGCGGGAAVGLWALLPGLLVLRRRRG